MSLIKLVITWLGLILVAKLHNIFGKRCEKTAFGVKKTWCRCEIIRFFSHFLCLLAVFFVSSRHDCDWRDADKWYADNDDVVGDADGVRTPTLHPSQQFYVGTMADGSRHGTHRRAVSAAIYLRIQTDGRDAGRMLQPALLHAGIAVMQHGRPIRTAAGTRSQEGMADGQRHLRPVGHHIDRYGIARRCAAKRGVASVAQGGICG